MLAPLPATGSDGIIEVSLGNPNGTEPEQVRIILSPIDLGASCEVQEVGRRSNGPTRGIGLRDRTVEDKTGGFQPSLGQVICVFDDPDGRIDGLIDGHELFPGFRAGVVLTSRR